MFAPAQQLPLAPGRRGAVQRKSAGASGRKALYLGCAAWAGSISTSLPVFGSR